MILGLQITALMFSFIMIYFALLHFRRRELESVEIVVWFTVWLFAIFAIVFPDIFQVYARQFKFARLFDMMVVGGIIIIFAMVARVYLAVKRTEKKLEELVRKESFKHVKKRKSN